MQVDISEADGAADGTVASCPAKRCRFSFDGQHGELAVPTVKAIRFACPAEPCYASDDNDRSSVRACDMARCYEAACHN